MVVEYAKTGEVKGLGFREAERLLPLADKWNMVGLLGMCSQLLRDHLHPRNSVGIWKFARAYHCADLERETLRYILYHIPTIMSEGECSEVFELGVTELEEILTNDRLNVNKEDELRILIKKWIAIDYTSRKVFRPRLNSHIRISKALFPSLFSSISPFKRYSLDTPYRSPRIPADVVLAIGGRSQGSMVETIESYDYKVRQWYTVRCKSFKPTAHYGLAIVGQKVFMVGGYDGYIDCDNVWCLDLLTLEWTESAPMNMARSGVSVVALGGFVYAMGGNIRGFKYKSVERYNPRTNRWTVIEPMQQFRSGASAVTLNGRIYVAGGFASILKHEVLKSVEVYTPETGHWTYAKDMSCPRVGMGMEVLNGELYVAGGFNGKNALRSVEKYSPLTRNWSSLPRLNTPRMFFGLAALNRQLYAIGGFNGKRTTKKVEKYEEEQGRWRGVEDLKQRRAAFKTLVITDLEDTRPFGFHGLGHT